MKNITNIEQWIVLPCDIESQIHHQMFGVFESLEILKRYRAAEREGDLTTQQSLKTDLYKFLTKLENHHDIQFFQ
jgi:hypothetical protein